MSPPIYTPDGNEVTKIVLPDGSTASEVVAPDGSVVFDAGPEIPDSALTQNLVAWYRFEDGDARDYASSAEFPYVTWGDSTSYDGTVNGATYLSSGGVTDFENGANSGAFDFDQDNIESELPTLSELSVSVWVNWDTLDSEYLGPIDTLGRRSSHQFTFHDDGGNSNILAVLTPNARVQFGTVTTNEWIHLLATYDGSTITTYFNGQQQNTASASFTADLATFGIGSRYNDLNKIVTDGQIDDVRVYNRALTSTEVSDIYNATGP